MKRVKGRKREEKGKWQESGKETKEQRFRETKLFFSLLPSKLKTRLLNVIFIKVYTDDPLEIQSVHNQLLFSLKYSLTLFLYKKNIRSRRVSYEVWKEGFAFWSALLFLPQEEGSRETDVKHVWFDGNRHENGKEKEKRPTEEGKTIIGRKRRGV